MIPGPGLEECRIQFVVCAWFIFEGAARWANYANASEPEKELGTEVTTQIKARQEDQPTGALTLKG